MSLVSLQEPVTFAQNSRSKKVSNEAQHGPAAHRWRSLVNCNYVAAEFTAN
jgi:hypothetical protein